MQASRLRRVGLPPTAHDDLSRQYSVMKGGNAAASSTPASTRPIFALNTSRRGARKVNCGRRSTSRSTGRRCSSGGKVRRQAHRSDPATPTCRASATRSSIRSRAPTRSREGAGRRGEGQHRPAVHHQPDVGRRAQIIKYNLEQIGLSVTLKPQPFGVAIRTAGTRGSDFDMFLIAWFADYPDPYDFINVLLDGQTSSRRTTRTTRTGAARSTTR